MDKVNIKFQMHKLIHDAEINMLKKREQLLRTPLRVIRNQTIQYPNTSHLNTKNTVTSKTQFYETNNQNVSDNVVLSETARTLNNNTHFFVTNHQDISDNVAHYEEVENESDETSLREYYINYNNNE